MGLLKTLVNKFKQKDEDEKQDYGQEFAKNRILVFVIPNVIYQDELLNITKSVAYKFDRIAYISINKPAEKVAEILGQDKIDTEKFLFIDAVNQDVNEITIYNNFALINSPSDLEKFKNGLYEILDKEKFDCVVFDSLSTMLIYQEANIVIRFMHDLIKRLTIANSAGTFTCLSEDVNTVLVKDVAMFVDRVIWASKQEKKEETNKKNLIAKLENELNSIKQAFESKLISEQSYLATKRRIEEKLAKLKSRKVLK